jgi:hypothetical protein
VFPSFEILQGIGGREDLALASVLGLVDDIGEVEVGASQGGIEDVLGAAGAMAVYVLREYGQHKIKKQVWSVRN